MNMRTIGMMGAAATVLLALGACDTPASDGAADGRAVSPDNTAVNERDRDANAVTPFDQGNNSADIETTAEIRREVLKVEGMSMTADNVKIITANGQVVLRGVVKSAGEKDQIQNIADHVAGVGKVDNQLEIDPD